MAYFQGNNIDKIDDDTLDMALDGSNGTLRVKDDGLTRAKLKNAGNFIVPIGSVMSWLKSYTNTPSLPDGWVECNGQTLSDADSVYNGQVIPDLNGDNRFLRGQSTSGGTGGSENHTHSITLNKGQTTPSVGSQTCGVSATGYTSTLPTYYEVVWIIRIK